MVRKQAEDSLSIAALARAAGVGVETVRYYQRRGLLETPEHPGERGHGRAIHRYGEKAARRLRFIRSAQTAGFTLGEIGELLLLDASNDRQRAYALACERIAALELKIAELERSRHALARLAHDCGGSDSGPCPILLAFERG